MRRERSTFMSARFSRLKLEDPPLLARSLFASASNPRAASAPFCSLFDVAIQAYGHSTQLSPLDPLELTEIFGHLLSVATVTEREGDRNRRVAWPRDHSILPWKLDRGDPDHRKILWLRKSSQAE